MGAYRHQKEKGWLGIGRLTETKLWILPLVITHYETRSSRANIVLEELLGL